MSWTEAQITDIKKKTDDAISEVLKLAVTYRMTKHIIEKNRSDWRDFQDYLHNAGYPIRGVGIIATPSNLEIIEGADGGFLHDEEDVAPEDIVSQLGYFPIDAATASYAFTMLEVYGDDIVKIVNPSYVQQRKAWHRDIYQGQNVKKLISAFSTPFKGDPLFAKSESTLRLIALKEARNSFAHDGDTNISVETFLAFVLGVMCQIYFQVLPEEVELKIYPWPGYDDKWD